MRGNSRPESEKEMLLPSEQQETMVLSNESEVRETGVSSLPMPLPRAGTGQGRGPFVWGWWGWLVVFVRFFCERPYRVYERPRITLRTSDKC